MVEMMNEQNGTKPLNILLVEDDDGDAKAVKRTFTKARIANPIIRAIDGVEALELMRGENGHEKLRAPYLLLVDLNMPRMDGIEFVKELRKDPEFSKTVVFILTTSKNEEDKTKAYELNVAGYIVKETAGQDFLNLVDLVQSYWRIVELPE
ncbi:response regulator [Sneathiella glossodoripedis]|uniref:response regulator n=1 Tax=Sneathiella glossodoripedis TaxID=418853 RepID=UPI0019025777|nr:response regulator [Sneathiella glossodoripedis]